MILVLYILSRKRLRFVVWGISTCIFSNYTKANKVDLFFTKVEIMSPMESQNFISDGISFTTPATCYPKYFRIKSNTYTHFKNNLQQSLRFGTMSHSSQQRMFYIVFKDLHFLNVHCDLKLHPVSG